MNREILTKGRYILKKDGGMKTLLLSIVLCVPLIVDAGSDSSVERKIREAEVFKAASEDDAASLERLLALDQSSANARDRSDETPLYRAARSGSLNAVNVLLKYGANMYAYKDVYAAGTPLFAAIRERPTHVRNAETIDRDNVIIKAFIKAGYDVNWRGKDGFTAIHVAVLSRASASTITLLITNGANVCTTTSSGDTPLHFVTRQDIAELLLANGADVHAMNRKGEVPAESVAGRGDIDLARFLSGYNKKTITSTPAEASRTSLPTPAQQSTGIATVRQLPVSSQIKLFVSTGKDHKAGQNYMNIQIRNQGMNNLTSVSVKWQIQGCGDSYSEAQTIALKPLQSMDLRAKSCSRYTGYVIEVFVDGQLAATERK